MLLQHFGLSEEPFGVTPDARFLYLSEEHRKALSILQTCIENNRGFLALVAPPGLGKTTLLYHMLEQSRRTRTATTAFVFQTQCDSRELLRQIIADLGIEAEDQDMVRNHKRLHEFLAKEANAGRYVIVFIDEAQNLSADALETVRLLSNFETSRSKLLQLVLAGQPSLASKLCSPGLVQLKQRLFAMIHLEPLSATETSAYITHRLTVAGYRGGRLFSPEAQALIVKRSEGIPRMINAICFGSLQIAHRRREHFIPQSIVQDALDVIAPQSPSDESTENEVAQVHPAGISFSGSTFDSARLRTLQARPSPKLSALEPSNANSSLVPSATVSAAFKAAQSETMARQNRKAVRPGKSRSDPKKLLLRFFAIGSGVLGASLVAAGVNRWQNPDQAVREEEIPFVHAMMTPASVAVKSATLMASPALTQPASREQRLRRARRLEPVATSSQNQSLNDGGNAPAKAIPRDSVLPSPALSDEDPGTVSARSVISPIVSPLPSDAPSELVYAPNPEYPKLALAAGLQGSVMLKAIIATDGSVKRPEMISGDPILAQAAIRTVIHWRYRPASVNGHPVENGVQIVFRFSLAKPTS